MQNTWMVDYYLGQFGEITWHSRGKFYLKQIILLYLEQDSPNSILIRSVAQKYGVKESTIKGAVRSYLKKGWPQQKWEWKHLAGWEAENLPSLPLALRLLCEHYQPFVRAYRSRIVSTLKLPYYLRTLLEQEWSKIQKIN